MNITNANPNDNEILSVITKKSKAYWGYSEDQIQKWNTNLTITKEYIEKNQVFNLIVNNQIIGYYSYIIQENKSIKLDNLFILPEFIGKGYGSNLLKHFLDIVKNEDYKTIILDAEPNAEKFYEKFGFLKIGEFETSIKGRFMPVMKLSL